MKGRQPGRPVKWVTANIQESIPVGKPGIQYEVWTKWKKQSKKHGTLLVNVGGLRWRSANGKISHQKSWDAVDEWFNPEPGA
jgi:hypothetical protein